MSDDNETADALEGLVVLTRALAKIGAEGETDRDLAKVIVDGERPLRALIKSVLRRVAGP